MPVRRTIVTWLGEQFMGAQVHNGLTQTCTSIGDDYYRVRNAADTAYVELVDRIDWARILLEASARHDALITAGIHPKERYATFESLCGVCVQAALLAEDRLINWVGRDGQPAPTEPPAMPAGDWAAVLADSVRYRRA